VKYRFKDATDDLNDELYICEYWVRRTWEAKSVGEEKRMSTADEESEDEGFLLPIPLSTFDAFSKLSV
jgi:hypothetical protein